MQDRKLAPLSFIGVACIAMVFTTACGSDRSSTSNGPDKTQGGGAGSGNAVSSDTSLSGNAGEGATEASAGSGNGSGAGGSTGTALPATGGSANSVVGCAPAVEKDGFVEVPATDPNIRFVGRVAKRAKSVGFAFPAVQIQARFEGDAIDLRLNDNGLDLAVATNYYWIFVDGVQSVLKPCQESQVYPLARNLAPGEHTLAIVKRTESGLGGHSSAGFGEFLGFRVRTGTNLKPVPSPNRVLEFVGDSITCGYGNGISTDDPASYKFTAANEDAWHAFGAVTAQALAADYVAIAASGRGIMRNYAGFTSLYMPSLYEMSLPEDTGAPKWDHTQYSPDAIVINLGTNDYSPGVPLEQWETHRASFRAAYATFLRRIREVHPSSAVVLSVGPMLNDDSPVGYNAWSSMQADVKAVIETRQAENDSNIFYFAFDPQQAPYGEDWHPTIATHQAMANALTPFLATLLGWRYP